MTRLVLCALCCDLVFLLSPTSRRCTTAADINGTFCPSARPVLCVNPSVRAIFHAQEAARYSFHLFPDEWLSFFILLGWELAGGPGP